MRLLCVENNSALCKMIDLMLAPTGVNVDFATTSDEAVEAYKINEYDAVVMDMEMPVAAGLKTAREIRQMEDGFHLDYTPILFLTTGDEDRMEQALEAGADGHLAKPFTTEALIGAIDNVMRAGQNDGLGQMLRAMR